MRTPHTTSTPQYRRDHRPTDPLYTHSTTRLRVSHTDATAVGAVGHGAHRPISLTEGLPLGIRARLVAITNLGAGRATPRAVGLSRAWDVVAVVGVFVGPSVAVSLCQDLEVELLRQLIHDVLVGLGHVHVLARVGAQVVQACVTAFLRNREHVGGAAWGV